MLSFESLLVSNPKNNLVKITLVLSNLSHKICLLVFTRFPELGEKVFSLSSDILENERCQTKQVVEDLVNSATGYFFTNDDLYLITHGAMQPAGSSDEMVQQLRSPQIVQGGTYSVDFNWGLDFWDFGFFINFLFFSILFFFL